MKRYFILIFICCVAIVSCTKEQPCITMVNESPVSLNKPLGEALADMNAFWSMVYKNESEGTRTTLLPTVESVNICKLPKTKGQKEDIDASVYLVNFINNTGYAVLNGNYNGPAILAFIEQGSIDADKLNSVLACVTVENELNQQMEKETFEDSDDYIYYLLAGIIISKDSNNREEIDTKVVSPGNYLQIVDHLPPIVTCKWGQTYPLNQCMPYFPNATYTSELRKRAPVGCVIVAAAQMMTKTNHPAFSQFSSNSYSWSDFSTISNWSNVYQFRYNMYSNYATEEIQTKVSALDQGLYLLSIPFLASYSPTLTVVNSNNIINGLLDLDYNYYGNATAEMLNWGVADVIDMLCDDKPTIAYGGSTSGGVGHAWLIDGYITYKETETTTRTALHFNWGNQKINDGYYAISATYSTTGRFVYETGYDMGYITESYDNTYGTVYYINY